MNLSTIEPIAKIPLYRVLLSGHIEAPGIRRSLREVNRRQKWLRVKASFLGIWGR